MAKHNPPRRFRVTYEIVTHESAAHGDAETRGFMCRDATRATLDKHGGTYRDVSLTLREALRLASPQEDCGAWWREVDGRTDYRTGAVETRAIHPPRNVTAASYARLSRVILGSN